MKIAQVAPLIESVPPRLYGGTERVVSYLTEELVRLGHEVTLFASGDSQTTARLVPCCRQALRLSGECNDHVVPHLLMLERVYSRADDFDIIHFHCDYLHYPLTRRAGPVPVPSVTTLHGRLDAPELATLYTEYSEINLISISNAQRTPIPWANWLATVHHGLPLDLYECRSGEARPTHDAVRADSHPPYLVFAGRMAREKRPDLAIEIARRAGMELLIAAKVDPADRAYFDREIRHLLDGANGDAGEAGPGVQFLGELDDRRKGELLANAQALLFPIDWPEPFGLVMIESLACGTPVIALNPPGSSVSEVITHGETGYIAASVDEAVEYVRRIGELSRLRCRAVFEKRFSAQRMAADYLNAYERIIHAASDTRRAARSAKSEPMMPASPSIRAASPY